LAAFCSSGLTRIGLILSGFSFEGHSHYASHSFWIWGGQMWKGDASTVENLLSPEKM
jgi:hypothetical protein